MLRTGFLVVLATIAATPASAVIVYTLSDFHLTGLFANVTASGTFTTGKTMQSQGTSDVTVIEHTNPITYTYHLSGPVNFTGWGPLPSQQPEFCFPGFGCQAPQPMTFHLGVINVGPGATAASFEDNLQLATGFGTVTAREVSDTPEPASWALLMVGFGAIGLAARRKARFAAGCCSADQCATAIATSLTQPLVPSSSSTSQKPPVFWPVG